MHSNNDSGDLPPADWKRREMKGIPASLGALYTRKTDSGYHYAAQLDESHVNAQGMIHGGVLMSFFDHALSLKIWEATDRSFCSTVHLDSHFLSAVHPPAFVELESEILKQGKNLVFARGVLLVEGKPVMEGKGVWSVVRKS